MSSRWIESMVREAEKECGYIESIPYVIQDEQGNYKWALGEPLTGWLTSDTLITTACPKCKQKKGYHCLTPKGRKAWPPHMERLLAYKGDIKKL